MAKKAPTEDLSLAECKQIVRRVRLGFETGMALAEETTPDDQAPDPTLDGVIGALAVCRGESSIAWVREALGRVQADRDKPQMEIELEDGDEEG